MNTPSRWALFLAGLAGLIGSASIQGQGIQSGPRPQPHRGFTAWNEPPPSNNQTGPSAASLATFPTSGSLPQAPNPLPWSPENTAFAPVQPDAVSSQGGPASREIGSTTIPEERLLLSLLEQERVLLIDFGPEYYQVQNIRARIGVIREYITQKKAEEVANRPPAPASVANAAGPRIANSLEPLPRDIIRTTLLLRPASPESVPRATSTPGAPLVIMKPWLDSPRLAAPVGKLFAPEGTNQVARSVSPPQPSPVGSPAQGSSAQAPKHASEPDRRVSDAAAPVWPLPMVLLLTIVVGLFVGLIIHFVTVLWLIRCFGPKLASLLHIEVTHHSSSSTAPPQTNPFQDVPIPNVSALAAQTIFGATTEHAPQLFDIGPTFEEERLAKKEEIERREGAVLMELFQQNLQLREQMNHLEVKVV